METESSKYINFYTRKYALIIGVLIKQISEDKYKAERNYAIYNLLKEIKNEKM